MFKYQNFRIFAQNFIKDIKKKRLFPRQALKLLFISFKFILIEVHLYEK